MSFSRPWLFFCSLSISSEMSTAESSCTKRSSSILVSSSAIGCSNSRNVVLAMVVRSVFHRDGIQAAPQVPGRNTAPWFPCGGQRGDLRSRALAGHRRTAEIVEAHRLEQPEVVQRQHIRPEQVEDQEHLGGPATDAADVHQFGNDVFVVALREAGRIHAPADKVLREVADVLDLAVRKPAGP